jgi:hypothetical protein
MAPSHSCQGAESAAQLLFSALQLGIGVLPRLTQRIELFGAGVTLTRQSLVDG